MTTEEFKTVKDTLFNAVPSLEYFNIANIGSAKSPDPRPINMDGQVIVQWRHKGYMTQYSTVIFGDEAANDIDFITSELLYIVITPGEWTFDEYKNSLNRDNRH